MTFVSYAQNAEDLVLWRALKTVERGTYIDLGAAWPTFHSVTKAFYDKGWSGLNIEPNPDLLKELNLERLRDRNLGVVIGETEGEAVINVMSNPGLSTVDADIASAHAEQGFEHNAVSAPMTTLAALCEAHLAEAADIHFLKVDVEGFEAPALRGNDWSRFRPWIIVVEAMEPMSQIPNHEGWEPILTEAGYGFIYTDGLNRYYLSDEKRDDLAESFLYPPSIFDDYMSVEHQQALQQNHHLQAELTSMKEHWQSLLRASDAQISDLNQGKQALEEKLDAQISDLNQGKQALEEKLDLLEESQRKLERKKRYLEKRTIFEVLLFDSAGAPRKLIRRVFFHGNGKTRKALRPVVLRRSGKPRPWFRHWMESEPYQSLPKAHPASWL